MATQILLERVGKVGFVNGIVRIECLSAGPDGKGESSGTLLIPGAEAGKALSALVKALQELHKKVLEKTGAPN
jgi:hypothetical protein